MATLTDTLRQDYTDLLRKVQTKYFSNQQALKRDRDTFSHANARRLDREVITARENAGPLRDNTLRDAAIKAAESRGWTYRREHLGEGHYGWSSRRGNDQGDVIAVRGDLTGLPEFATFLHERAHTMMHYDLHSSQYARAQDFYEFEAEAVSYLVLKHFGYDMTDTSVTYLAGWATQREGAFGSYYSARGDIVKAAERLITEITVWAYPKTKVPQEVTA